jgi:PAS domain S-box-containing protein
MRSVIGINTAIGFGLLIALVIVNSIIAYRNIDQLHETSKRMAQTQDVLTTLEQFFSTVRDAETGQRGYLITGEPRYLEPYHRAVAVVRERQQRLRELPDGFSRTGARLDELNRLVDAKFAELERTIQLMDTKGFPAAREEVRTHLGRQWMEEIRATIDDLRAEERKALDENRAQAEKNYITALTTTLLAACLSLAIVGVAFHLIRRELFARQRAEAYAHQQGEWHRTTLTSIGDAVIVTDDAGRILLLNPVAAQLTGWGADAVGQALETVFVIYNELTRQPVESPVAKVLRDGTIVGLANHTLLKARDGREIPIDDSGAPIRDRQGRVTGVVLVFRDVTDRRQTEAALLQHAAVLQEADRRKDEFLAMLAHELRNPLAPIHNAAQIMKLEGRHGPNFDWSLQVIVHQLVHLTRLVDDLLDVSRITQGKVKLQKERVKLAQVVERAVETCRPLIDERRHQLTVSLGDAPMPLEADLTRLTQVFSNLLNNAAKYTEVGGQIALTAAVEGQEVVVRIRDSGVGIAAEMLPRIFDLFAQADKSLARTSGGLGIGLTLVRRLVELHGGRIAATSSGPGKGSEFVVTLPLAESEKAAAANGPKETEQQEKSQQRILVVDDNRDSAKSIAVLLRAGGDTVELAFDGPMALEAARHLRPDVVLLDIGLPGMDGYEVARQLRRDASLKNVVLIAMTGYGQDGDRQQSQEAGFNAHLVKPVDLNMLQSLLARASQNATP